MTLALLCDNKGPSAICQQKFRTASTLNYLYGLNSFNIFKQHFRNFDLQNGVEMKPQKRQLLAHAAVEVEKYMSEKLYFGGIQICASFICQPNRFLSTYEEMAKG